MASVTRDKAGNRRILFCLPDGKRPTLYLGKMTQRAAESIKARVEQLLEAQTLKRPMDANLAQWVADLEPALAKKMGRIGLIPKPEAKEAATLGVFLNAYIVSRIDLKPLTIRHLNDARRNLVEYFGEDKPLGDITPGDGDEFRLHLSKTLGDNTVRRKCGRAKQFFRAAVRKRLIRENPFADMKGCGVQANRTRDFFITREMAASVLEACPDNQWRLIFALSRFGGLRCPSEHLALTWANVDWERNRMKVSSPKTEHHEGGESRWIPIFPELRPHLEQAWEDAEPGTEFVITKYRDPNANLRTQFERIIHRAGLESWPKLFQNLRASRETELAQTFPLLVVCEWIGNSTTIAAKHYLQVTDEHYQAALNAATNSTGDKATQNPTQQGYAEGRKDKPTEETRNAKPLVLQGVANLNEILHECQVPPDGLEPSTL